MLVEDLEEEKHQKEPTAQVRVVKCSSQVRTWC